MANKKISELTAITAANTAADDVFAVVDTSSTETKKISRDELKTAVAQSGAEIKAAYEAEANAFTDAQFTKLAGIETSADVTDTTNVTAAGALMDSEVTNLAQVKAFDSSDYATAAQGTTADAALPRTGGAMTGAITTNSTFDGRNVSVDGSKLDGIEVGATADQTASEIRALVESATDSNVFTDADHTKLNGIEASADVTDAANVEPLVDAHLNTSTAATNEVLSWTGTDYDWVAQSGAGASLDLYAESYDGTSTAPSATGTNSVAIGKGSTASGQESMAILDGNSVSQDSFSMGGNVYANAIGGTQIGKGGIVGGSGFSANYSVSIGYQGVSAQVQSIAIGKGYSGGTSSFAAQITDNSSSYGAIGANSIAIGNKTKAISTSTVAIGGTFTFADGANSVAIGKDSTTVGARCFALNGGIATSADSMAIGNHAATKTVIGQISMSGGFRFSAGGDSQQGTYILRSDTTDATSEALTTNNSAASSTNQIILENNSAYAFHGTIVARESAASGTDCAAWKIEGLIRREGSAATTVLVNSATTVLDNTSNWGMALSADTTNGGLAITVTGVAATSVRWVGTIHASQVTYA